MGRDVHPATNAVQPSRKERRDRQPCEPGPAFMTGLPEKARQQLHKIVVFHVTKFTTQVFWFRRKLMGFFLVPFVVSGKSTVL
jgi:hypothetical protein